MKLFAPALIFCGAASFGQSPQVPHKMQFAGMTLTLRDDARREIQKDVDALTNSPKYFSIKAERAKTYFPIVEKVFEEERLPLDFKYLAIQESALIADAVSSSNAVGFWQFKDFTAIEMGMRVDAGIDERMNIASASRGAARYLKQCNHYFNNWIYALQAYQMGAGGVMRAVGDKDLGSRQVEITTDTYWYVKKFLAHKVAFENAVEGKPMLEVTAIGNAAGKTLAEISAETSVDEQKLREFNKWLKAERIPDDKEYAVLVPRGDISPEFGVLTISAAQPMKLTAVEMVAIEKEKEINGIPVVQAMEGESLAALAARAGISISRFLSYNEMEIDRPILAGHLYFLDKKKKHGGQELYTSKAGDDAWTVSQRFGIRQKFLMKYNKLETERAIKAGVTLYLANGKPETAVEADDSIVAVLDEAEGFDWDLSLSPAAIPVKIRAIDSLVHDGSVVSMPLITKRTVVLAASGGSIHEVRLSDTLYSVARQYGVTIKEIMEWNDKKDFSLSVGEKLRVR